MPVGEVFVGTREHRGVRERSVMLRRVRQKVSDELGAAFGTAGRLEVPALRRRGDDPGQPLPPGNGLSAAYDEARDSLLVLGPAGSGKSTALYELAAHLLGRAERDPAQPIPVVLHLGSWAGFATRPDRASAGRDKVGRDKAGRLEAWLADELAAVYDVPDRLARAWVADELVVPLLDGLDEVAAETRPSCAEQITAFRRRHGMVRLALTSTAEAYQPCSRALRLHEIVELQPLGRSRISAYLGRAGVRLDAAEAGTGRWELLSSPLMLSLAATAHRNGNLEAVPAGSPQARRPQMFGDLISQAAVTDPGAPRTFPAERTLDWLARLARSMRDRGASEFRLDLIQPDWLTKRYEQRLVMLAPHLLAGLTALVLSFGLYAPQAGALPALALAATALALNALISVPLSAPERRPIEPVEPADWRPAGAGLVRLPGMAAVRTRGTRGTGGGDGTGDADWTGAGRSGDAGWVEPERPGPAARIDRSARTAGVAAGWLLLLVLVPLVLLLVADGAGSFAVRLAATVTLVLVVLVLPVAMRNGGRACCRHLALRAVLVREGRAPWRFGRLLTEADRQGLLVRTGSGYRFPHRLIADHVAGLSLVTAPAVEAPERTTAPAVPRR